MVTPQLARLGNFLSQYTPKGVVTCFARILGLETHSRGAIRFLINVGISTGCSSEVVSQGYAVTNDYKTLMGVVTLLAAVVLALLRIEAIGVLWPLRETPRCPRNSHFYDRPLKRGPRAPPCFLKHPQARSALAWPCQSRSPLFNMGCVELY